MLKLRRPVVVEGRYDRIRLSALIDGVILETGGFRIFKDREMLAALRALAKSPGLILLTDSDAAGFKIRSFLKNALGSSARISHVYIPGIHGKEPRKTRASAEGLLGVEGMDEETLLKAFEQAGIGCETVINKSEITRADLFDAGLIGAKDSSMRRRKLLQGLWLPPRLSTGAMIEILATLLTREEFLARIAQLDESGTP